MIKIDIKNKDFEIDGNGETLLVEFVEVGRQLTEMMSGKLGITKEDFLNYAFKTIKFAAEGSNENN